MSWWKSGSSRETGGSSRKAKTVENSSVPNDDDIDTGTTLIALKHKRGLIFAIDGLSSYDTGETFEVYDYKIRPLGEPPANFYCLLAGNRRTLDDVMDKVSVKVKREHLDVARTAKEIKAFWMSDKKYREEKKAAVIALGGFSNGNRKLWAVETIENRQESFEVIADSYFGGSGAEIASNGFRNYTPTMREDVVINLIKNAMLDSSKERPNRQGKLVQRTGGMIYAFKINEKNEQEWKIKTHIEKLKKEKEQGLF